MANQNQFYHSRNFKKILEQKKRLILPLTLFFFLYFLLLPILTSFFPELANLHIYGPITFAWLFAFSQFIMSWFICYVYYKKAKSIDLSVEKLEEEVLNKGAASK